MSAIKRHLENLAVFTADAIYNELYDFSDYIDRTYSEIQAETMDAIMSGDIRTVYDFISGICSDMEFTTEETPLSHEALRRLEQWL